MVDVLVSESPHESVQDYLLPRIYRDYGQLFIRGFGRGFGQGGLWRRELNPRPWSSWWYPRNSDHLFQAKNGRKSVLEKYDAYVRAQTGRMTEAAEFERRRLYRPDAEAWEGLCHAWAVVSLLYPEPDKPIVVHGIEFSVDDQKALLIKTYENYLSRHYGVRFLDQTHSEWQKIRPDLFHRFVQAELLEAGRPFIMNRVPGMEEWNVPVWGATLQLRQDEKNSALFHVTALLQVGALLSEPSDEPRSASSIIVYTYDLFTKTDELGRSLVTGGEWTGVSRDEHPSILIAVPGREAPHSSRNAEIENDIVEELLKITSHLPAA